jgi:hypothetical protein
VRLATFVIGEHVEHAERRRFTRIANHAIIDARLIEPLRSKAGYLRFLPAASSGGSPTLTICHLLVSRSIAVDTDTRWLNRQ